MILIALVYTTVLSVLVTGIALLLEQTGRAWHRPTRWIWIGAMTTMAVLGLAAARPSLLFPPAAPSAMVMRLGASHTTDDARAAASMTVGTETPSRAGGRGTFATLLRSRTRLGAMLSTFAPRLRAWDGGILWAWLVLSALIAGIVVHAASEAHRMRRGLEARETDGTTVLVTEDLGPAASGVRAPVILMPRWVLELDTSLRDLVLAHEREHLAARDSLLLLGALCTLVAVPWMLSLWWSWGRLRLAIEIDCDARVLRSHPGVRRYAELLLLVSQRINSAPLAGRWAMTIAAPLQPELSHLSHRVLAMTQSRAPRSPLQVASVVAGVALLAAAACALPRPRAVRAAQAQTQEQTQADVHLTSAAQFEQRERRRELECAYTVEQRNSGAPTLVHLTSVGLSGATSAGDSLADTLLVYAPGPARVGLESAAPTPLTDTLRLQRFPAMTIDVSKSDVHLFLTGSGRVEASASVTGGASTGFSGSGKHLILLKGGCGISIPSESAAAQGMAAGG